MRTEWKTKEKRKGKKEKQHKTIRKGLEMNKERKKRERRSLGNLSTKRM